MVYQSEGMWKSEEDSQVEPRSAFVKRGFCIQNYYSLTYQTKRVAASYSKTVTSYCHLTSSSFHGILAKYVSGRPSVTHVRL